MGRHQTVAGTTGLVDETNLELWFPTSRPAGSESGENTRMDRLASGRGIRPRLWCGVCALPRCVSSAIPSSNEENDHDETVLRKMLPSESKSECYQGKLFLPLARRAPKF